MSHRSREMMRSPRTTPSRWLLPSLLVWALSLCWFAALPQAYAQDTGAARAATLMKQADALAAAGKYQQAGVAYANAAKAFEAAGKFEQQAQALEKSAAMYEKLADQLTKGTNNAAKDATPASPATPTTLPPAAAQPAAQPAAANAPVRAGAAPLPLETSAIVSKNAKGQPAVAAKNGKPIEGVKLSRHDTDIRIPSIAVAPNGTIHVAFIEQRAEAPFTVSVYHRSSGDGGKTWSEAKNLSEVMPDYQVGNCQVVADGASRVYVIWRTGVKPNFPVGTDPHALPNHHLVYRVLDGGKWSGKAILMHPDYPENDGAASWFACTDPAGRVHVIWNMLPYSRHPETMTPNGKSPAIGSGMIMEADLNGTDPGTPREIYCAKIFPDPQYQWPRCDDFDTVNGYVDAAGQAHILAKVAHVGVDPEPANRFELIEDGKQTPALALPGRVFDYWRDPPTLLLDAQGRRHIIVMYQAGEQPNVRDYLFGSEDEPTVIRAAKAVKGKLMGFQAYQGPAGRMVALMQMNDTGKDTDDELYLSTSDGTKWSAPVNVTNNTGRESFALHETSALHASHVATLSYWYPGPAAAAYDRQGHLTLAYISNELSVVQSTALGWTLAGGSTKTPKLLFLRF